MGNTTTRLENWKSGNSEYDNDRVKEKYVKCIECVRLIPVLSFNELKPGHHIVFRNVHYDHHGIVYSVDNVKKTLIIIEVSNTPAGASLGIVSSWFPLVAKSKANIIASRKTLDFKTEKIALVCYRKRLSRKKTVKRAVHYASTISFRYNLFSNNCEHFATYCATGHKLSLQVLKFQLSVKLVRRYGSSTLGIEKARYGLLHDSKFICDSCYQMYEFLLSVETIPIKSAQDINSGDIIRFSYCTLLHDAVVINKEKYTEKVVILTIAHYAFCGLKEHRTIVIEIKELNLDGTSFKVDYKSPKFKICHSQTVVNRARARVGEKFHNFWTFNSSHFARWCKLQHDQS